LFGKTLLKAQNDYIFQKFAGAMGPLATPMVDVHGGDDLYCRWMRDFAFVMRRSPLNYPHYCSVCSNVA